MNIEASRGHGLATGSCHLDYERDPKATQSKRSKIPCRKKPTACSVERPCVYSRHPRNLGYLESSTSSTTLSSGRVGRSRSDILNSTDSHSSSSQSSESGLSTWTRLLGTGTTGSSELDVESGDSDLLALGSDVLSSQHSGVRLKVSLTSVYKEMVAYRRLVSVSLDLHSTGNSGDGLLARKIGNVDESVVEPDL